MTAPAFDTDPATAAPPNLTDAITAIIDRMNDVARSYPEGASPPVTWGDLRVLIGDSDDTSLDAPPGIVWVPLAEEYREPVHQPDDESLHAIYEVLTTCEVRIWGHTLTEVENLRTALFAAGWSLYSPYAFKPGRGGKYTKSTPMGEYGLCLTLPITFVIPLPDEIAPTATFQTVTTGVQVTDPPDDANAEDLPP